MARGPNLLAETLDAWTYAREGVIAELENIPADRFDFRPTPQSRTVNELARHILQAGLVAVGELTRADGDFQRQSYPEFLEEYAGAHDQASGKAPLIGLLRQALDDGKRTFERSGEPAMLRPITQFNGEPATRLTWFNHAIAHEEYHRGQVALYARLMGLVPALTQLIEGDA
jgi:uncharacterized damage-inducible protein DinB